MATWADRRDAYVMQRNAFAREDEARLREEQKRNALNQILAQSYESQKAAQPAIYGPVSQEQYLVGVDPGGVGQEAMPERPGGLDIQNALAKLYQSGRGDIAMALEDKIAERETKRMQLGQRPSAVQVFEYWKSLKSPQEQENMLRTMRGAQYGDIGGVRHEMPVLPGGPARPLGTLAGEVSAEAAIAGGKAAGKTKGEATAEAQIAIPGAEKVAETTERYIDELKNHKGKKYSLGAASIIPTQVTPGTSRVDFKARLDQLKGGAFLEARQLLKGGGQITDFEGKRAEAAMARLETAQTEEAFDAALEDFRSAIKDGVSKLKQRATGQPMEKSTRPKVGHIEGGYAYTGGDPADSKNWKLAK